MANGEKSHTPAGNIRAPSMLLCLQWVKQAWDCVTKEVIIKSLEVCGISVSTDGSEEDKIHCVKVGEIAETAMEEIQSKTRVLNDPHDLDYDIDPFADLEPQFIEDKGELENNEHDTEFPVCFKKKETVFESSLETCPTILYAFTIATAYLSWALPVSGTRVSSSPITVVQIVLYI
uniref:DDE-1 domain-containing protein n=2 Tax=Amphimedon queenslandica TaxID=400682 RepID=A0A1X7UQJ6_AMPQE